MKKKNKPILMGRNHVPLFALRPDATDSERLATRMMATGPGVTVVRFDLTDRERFRMNVVTDDRQ